MLSPLAAQNVDVLRRIATGQFTTKAALAASFDPPRDLSNFGKSLSRLEGEGFIAWPSLTDAGKTFLLAVDVAEGKAVVGGAGQAAPEGYAYRFHRQIRIGKLNPRKRFDQASLDELMHDIAERGLKTNLEVREDDPQPDGEGLATNELVAGERRWRAIGQGIKQGLLDRDFPILVKLESLTEAEHRVAALLENLQREALAPLEEATAFDELMKAEGWSTADLAARLKLSQKTVQNRIRLLKLPADLKARMELPEDDPRHLGYKQALSDHLIEKRAPVAPKEAVPPKLELPPKLALALVELADRVAKFPAKLHELGFTELLHRPTGGALPGLHDRKVITYREWGGTTFVKILAFSSGAMAWLEEWGFNADPANAIGRAREMVLSPAARERLDASGLYATEELNVPVEAEVELQVDVPTAANPGRSDDHSRAAVNVADLIDRRQDILISAYVARSSEITLATALTATDGRMLGGCLFESGRFSKIVMHHRSGSFLQGWGDQ